MHPNDLRAYHFMRRVSDFEAQPLADVLDTLEPGDLLTGTYRHRVYEKWWPVASSNSFVLTAAARTRADAVLHKPPVFWCQVENTAVPAEA